MPFWESVGRFGVRGGDPLLFLLHSCILSRSVSQDICAIQRSDDAVSKTYAELAQEIESLQKQAESLKEREVGEVIARMKEAIRVYGLTPEDLGFASAKRGRKPGRKSGAATAKKVGRTARSNAAGKKAGKRAAAYKDASGNVWSGRGPRPRWLKEALAGGASLQDFAV